MKLRVFCVYDIKAEMFSPPFVKGTIGEAVRDFQDLVNNQDTTIARHPGDYKLCCIGEFDNVSGSLVPGDVESLGFGSDYKALGASAIPLSVAKG